MPVAYAAAPHTHSRFWYKVPYHAICRDYILRKFSEGESVSHKEITSLMRDLSPTLLDVMLAEIAIFDQEAHLWCFKRDRDHAVEEEFRHVVAKSGKMRTEAELKKQIQHGISFGAVSKGQGQGQGGAAQWGGAAGVKRRADGTDSSAGGAAGGRRVAGAGGGGGSGAAAVASGGGGGGGFGGGGSGGFSDGATLLTPCGNAVQQVLKKEGILTLACITQGVHALTSNTFSDHDIEVAVGQVCLSVRGRHILRLTGDPQFDTWRKLIVELFEDKEQLRRKDVFQKVLDKTGATIPPNSYKKVMKSVASTGGDDGKSTSVWTLLPGTPRSGGADAADADTDARDAGGGGGSSSATAT